MSFGSTFLGRCTDPPLSSPRSGIDRARTKACSPPGRSWACLPRLSVLRRRQGWVGSWNRRAVPLAARLGRTKWVSGLFFTALVVTTGVAQGDAELLEVRKIWDRAPHNAFTDLVRFKGRWFCVFREGTAHVSPDGALRVITSKDGKDWVSAALLTQPNADLRDAKITLTPDNQLMLSGAGALHQPAAFKHQSLAWFSNDGREWSDPVKIGDPNVWLWRVTWHRKTAYSIGYDTRSEEFIRLFSSGNGREFDTLVPNLFNQGRPNETSLVFQPDETALCLLRRDGDPASAKLGVAKPPYRDWRWKDLGVKIGGPHTIRLPDGRVVAAVRLYDGAVRTSLAWLDADAGKLAEFLKLPSGGDTSYAGLVWEDGMLWVSYYSSHEDKACIYLAKVRIRPKGS